MIGGALMGGGFERSSLGFGSERENESLEKCVKIR